MSTYKLFKNSDSIGQIESSPLWNSSDDVKKQISMFIKKLLTALFSASTLTSCMNNYVLYLMDPQFTTVPVIEDDSLRIEYKYYWLDPMTITAIITNKAKGPAYIIWEKASIDSLEVCFNLSANHIGYDPELIKPNSTIERKLAIKEFYLPRMMTLFNDEAAKYWGYDEHEIIIPVRFGRNRKDYYTDLYLTVTKKGG